MERRTYVQPQVPIESTRPAMQPVEICRSRAHVRYISGRPEQSRSPSGVVSASAGQAIRLLGTATSRERMHQFRNPASATTSRRQAQLRLRGQRWSPPRGIDQFGQRHMRLRRSIPRPPTRSASPPAYRPQSGRKRRNAQAGSPGMVVTQRIELVRMTGCAREHGRISSQFAKGEILCGNLSSY